MQTAPSVPDRLAPPGGAGGNATQVRTVLCLLVAFAVKANLLAGNVESVTDETTVKAAYLYQLAHFVSWPADAFATSQEPIRICVTGNGYFGYALQRIVNGKTIANRQVEIRLGTHRRQPWPCHLMFIAASEQKYTKELLSAGEGQSVLTVGETDDFLTDGGMISFRFANGRIRFEVSTAAATAVKPRISSKLLSLAHNERQLVRR